MSKLRSSHLIKTTTEAKMKKITTIFVMLLFMFSIVPVAFAKSDVSATAVSIDTAVTSTDTISEEDEKALLEEVEDLPEETCISKLVSKGVNKLRARVLCKRRRIVNKAVTTTLKNNENAKERLENCIEKYEAEGISEEDAKKKCLTKARTIVKNRVMTIAKNKFESLSEEEQVKILELKKENQRKLGIVLGATALKKLGNLTEDELTKISKLDRGKIKEISSLTADKIKDRIKNFRTTKAKAKDLYKKRTITKERLEKAETRYNAAKAKYQTARTEFTELKKEFAESVKGKSEAEQVEAAKTYLSKTIDMITSHLEQVKEKIEGFRYNIFSSFHNGRWKSNYYSFIRRRTNSSISCSY